MDRRVLYRHARSLVTVAGAFAALSSAALAQPANDTCAGATPVVDGNNAISNGGATFDTANPCSTGLSVGDETPPYNKDVWYTYTAPATGLRNFEVTNDPYGGFGFALALYDTCGGTRLACDYTGASNGYSKIYHFAVTQGVTYRIHVAGVYAAEGPGTLRIYQPPAPSVIAGDECSTAIAVIGQPATATFNTSGFTNSDTQAWDRAQLGRDGWFAWTPSVSGLGVVSGCGYTSSPATPAAFLRTSVYDACGTVPLVVESTFQDPPAASCSPRSGFEVVAGHTYYIRYGVDHPTSNASGTLSFAVRPLTPVVIPAGAIPEPGECETPPSADLNAGCDLPSLQYTPVSLCQVRSGTASARLLPLYVGITTNQAIYSYDTDWYSFTLNADQQITLTGQSEFPPLVRLFSGCPGTVLNPVAPVLKQTAFQVNVSGPFDLLAGSPTNLQPFTANLISGEYYVAVSPQPGYASDSCGHGDKYWFSITGSDPCPGACCTGTTCTTSTQSACTGAFQGAGTACGVSGNPTACCPANFDGLNGLQVADIFSFLNAWFAGNTQADFDHANGLQVSDIFAFLNAWFAGC